MRVIFLNIWYAKVGKPLYDFISSESTKADIFGLSEISPEMFSRISKMLVEFEGFYDAGPFDINMGLIYGQSLFAKKGIKIEKFKKIDTFHNIHSDQGWINPYKLSIGNKNFYIENVHGKAQPGTKLDTPIRIRQSQKMINFFKDKNGPKIIGGDLNLYPDTKSIAMIEEAGYKNLIKEFKIDTTRNRLSWEQFDNIQYFADYCFVSPEIKVINFNVPKIEISDHLPLILDFSFDYAQD